MNSLKDIKIGELKELRGDRLKSLKISNLKNLILKPEGSRMGNICDFDLEDLTKKRENVKRKINQLNKEKKRIEAHINMIQKSRKEKREEISEFPWREEIFPPFRRKIDVKIPEVPEINDNSLHSEDFEFSGLKNSKMKVMIKAIEEKSGNNILGKKKSEDIEPAEPATIQIRTINNYISAEGSVKDSAEGAELKKYMVKKGEEKALPEKEEKIKNEYPFSARKVNEYRRTDRNIVQGPIGNDKPAPIEKMRHETGKTVIGLSGEDLIEELMNNSDLNPEEDKGFIKYLHEPEIEELIEGLKDIRYRMDREKRAG